MPPDSYAAHGYTPTAKEITLERPLFTYSLFSLSIAARRPYHVGRPTPYARFKRIPATSLQRASRIESVREDILEARGVGEGIVGGGGMCIA